MTRPSSGLLESFGIGLDDGGLTLSEVAASEGDVITSINFGVGGPLFSPTLTTLTIPGDDVADRCS